MARDDPFPRTHGFGMDAEPAPSETGLAAGVAIGPVRFGELRRTARLQRRAFRRQLAYGLGTLGVLWLLPNVQFLVAREGEAIVGCAIGDRQGDDARVINICVDPAAQRRGIGRALLRALEAALPEGNMILMVEEGNAAARALYASEGYLAVGTAPNYYGRGQNGIWMQKQRTDRPSSRLWT